MGGDRYYKKQMCIRDRCMEQRRCIEEGLFEIFIKYEKQQENNNYLEAAEMCIRDKCHSKQRRALAYRTTRLCGKVPFCPAIIRKLILLHNLCF